MAGKSSKGFWQGLERKVAEDYSKVLGYQTFRVPLSGINSRHSGGDVIIPSHPDGTLVHNILFECKGRSSNAQHTLYENAAKDAIKNKVRLVNTVLCTKVKYSQGYLVTINKELFWRLMALEGAIEVLNGKS